MASSLSIPSNLSSSQIGNVANNIPGVGAAIGTAKAAAGAVMAKAEAAQATLKKGKAIADKAKKELEKVKNAKNFLKDQTKLSPADVKNILVAAALPLLTKFINTEKVANLLLDKLTNEAKKKLSKYGRVEISNGTITFTPKSKGDYEKYAQNFKRKIDALKSAVAMLKKIIDALVTLLKIIRAGLIAIKVYIAILKAKLKAMAAAAATETALPSPSKPATAAYLAFKEATDPIINVLEKKIDDYILMTTVISSILGIFKKMIDKIKEKLDKINIIINGLPDPSNSLSQELNTTKTVTGQQTPEDYEDDKGNQYTIRVTTNPSGAVQVAAYDKYTNLKIAETAPSKTRGADKLLDEIKQILG
jgi:DNA replication initiation complex subunit (GINS family)